jgi:hypothetical protein
LDCAAASGLGLFHIELDVDELALNTSPTSASGKTLALNLFSHTRWYERQQSEFLHLLPQISPASSHVPLRGNAGSTALKANGENKYGDHLHEQLGFWLLWES